MATAAYGLQLGGQGVDEICLLHCLISANGLACVSGPSSYKALEFTDCKAAGNGNDTLPVSKPLATPGTNAAHPQTEDGRKIRRLDARIGALAFERFDQAGFFAADVSARAAMNVDLQIVAACRECFCRGNFSRELP